MVPAVLSFSSRIDIIILVGIFAFDSRDYTRDRKKQKWQ